LKDHLIFIHLNSVMKDDSLVGIEYPKKSKIYKKFMLGCQP
jgi:hypothetical protein